VVLSGKKKNLVNFSCTSRHRGNGMLRSFERRFDLKCSGFFHSQRGFAHRAAEAALPLPPFGEKRKMRQHITPVSPSRVNEKEKWCKRNTEIQMQTVCTQSQRLSPRAEEEKKLRQTGFEDSCFFGQLVLGLASGLEAFSREPPCDSIGALAVRQTPETSGMAWEFLSYYPKLPSRCLRDPLRYLVL